MGECLSKTEKEERLENEVIASLPDKLLQIVLDYGNEDILANWSIYVSRASNSIYFVYKTGLTLWITDPKVKYWYYSPKPGTRVRFQCVAPEGGTSAWARIEEGSVPDEHMTIVDRTKQIKDWWDCPGSKWMITCKRDKIILFGDYAELTLQSDGTPVSVIVGKLSELRSREKKNV